MIQESGDGAKPILQKIDELASLPEVKFTAEEMEEIRRVGDNKGCMDLKGANPAHSGETLPDRWSITNDLGLVANRWQIQPERDLVHTH
jgi:hypothetical protein